MDIRNYSEALKHEKFQYIHDRNDLLNDFLKNRKAERDITWFLKRLNHHSALIIINALNNKSKYKLNVLNYINTR